MTLNLRGIGMRYSLTLGIVYMNNQSKSRHFVIRHYLEIILSLLSYCNEKTGFSLSL